MPVSTTAKSVLPGAVRQSKIEDVIDAIMPVLGRVLEVLFFAGMAGSALVVVISAVEDIYTILEKD